MTRVAERHKWNETFEWEPARGPFRRITEEQAAAYDENGFFVFEGAFDADTITRIREEIDPYEEKSTQFLRERHIGWLIHCRTSPPTSHKRTSCRMMRGRALRRRRA